MAIYNVDKSTGNITETAGRYSSGGSNDLAKKADIAPIFDTTVAYAVGDLCYYDGILYEFTSAHAAGAWNSAEVEVKKISEKIEELESNFQDGVDAVYDAVVAKGSTPASHSLSDVVDGIASIETTPPTQIKSCTPSTSAQTITPDDGYLLSSVSVDAIQTQTKNCTPSTSAQTISPDSGKYLSSVSVGAIATQEKSCTPSTSSQAITPDSGKYLSKVTVNAISTQTKTVTSSRSAQNVTPDSGKYLTKVTVNKYPDASGTYTASSRGSALDMGATNNLRYVNTNSVPNTNSGTYTYASGSTGGTVDLGATNTYRYVNAANVYAKGKADGDVVRTLYYYHNGRNARVCRSANPDDYYVSWNCDATSEWHYDGSFNA